MYLKENVLEGGLEIDHSDETQKIKMTKTKFLVHRYLPAIFFLKINLESVFGKANAF